jgi:hypothetical protein
MKKRLLVVALVGLLLSACSFDFSADLYMQDIADILETQEPIYTNAIFGFEFSGDEEDKQKAIQLLTTNLYEAENFREEDRDFQTFLLADYKIPLIYAATLEDIHANPELQKHLLALAITRNEGRLDVYAVFNQALFDRLDNQIYEESYQHLELAESSMRVFLINDSREAISATVAGMYVNNAPMPYEGTFSMERRDQIEIRFSDVLRDSFGVQLDTDTANIKIRKFAEIVSGTAG